MSKPHKIAIIEDDAALVELYRFKFELEGWKVQAAGDGNQGLALIAEFHPDLVMLDLLMPNMDGIDMIERLRKQRGGQAVKVIVLTNIFDSLTYARVNKSNPVDYIIKADATPQEIFDRVKSLA